MKFLLVFLTSVSLWASDNKIVYLIAAPRSLSTAAFRMFVNRDDFTGFHEPTIPVYDRIVHPELTKDWFGKNEFFSFKELKEKIFRENKKSHVIIKDVSFSAEDFILLNEDFVQNSKVHFIFLVRDPYQIVSSFYKAKRVIDESFYDLIGIKQLYNIYQNTKKENPNRVHLIFIDDLKNDPRGTLEPIFKSMNIPFSEQSLSWESLDDSFTGDSWHEQKKSQLFLRWHEAALKSTHIRKTPPFIKPSKEMMFIEAATKKHRQLLLNVYRYHLPYYEKFLEERSN